MPSPTIRERQKIHHNGSWSSWDSLPNHLAHPPRHPQYLEADRAALSVSSSSTLSSAPPSPKCPVPRAHAMSCTASTMPSSKLPFSNSVTGTVPVWIGPLASFGSEARRGRPTSAAECHAASCSSGLSRAAVLLSGLGGVSPPGTPQPSASIQAAFCPLTSDAWQSGTLRDGTAADADKTSTGSNTVPGTTLQSPLLFSSVWLQQGELAAAHDTLRSYAGVSDRFLNSGAAEGGDAQDTVHSSGAAYSSNRSASRLSAPKDFVPVYLVRSPVPFAKDFGFSPASEGFPSAQPNTRAPRTGTAKGTSATPAPSSCLPSETLEQHSLLRSPLLRSLTPPSISSSAPLSPGLGCIVGSDQAQSRLSRHRLAASPRSEERFARAGSEMRSRGAAEESPLPVTATSLKGNVKAFEHPLATPARHNFRGPLCSSNEESLPSFFVGKDVEAQATPVTINVSEEEVAHRAFSANVLRSGPSEETEAEEGVTSTADPTTTEDPFEVFWGFSTAPGWGSDATEMRPHGTTSAPWETAPAFCGIGAFASDTRETGGRVSGELSQHNRLSHAAHHRQRGAILHRPSAGQQRNSVNNSTDPQHTSSKEVTLQRRQRRFSVPHDDAIEVKRRSGA
ncbi:hypothetical protein LSCM4_00775 [Leishmania orientalis]|uniref:Uncharacterized protein n=1 Tax=Leishmania orientalis TaxID=2249476 RepID=A0A836FRB4_9TRYP|nr:hypothetical protein LSCM4_00775 [Leishmania orientalis]